MCVYAWFIAVVDVPSCRVTTAAYCDVCVCVKEKESEKGGGGPSPNWMMEEINDSTAAKTN